jgi:hypothetical protein
VNGSDAVPIAPAATNAVGPQFGSTTLFVMSSISIAIEVGMTGVFVWSTNL